MKDEFIAKIMTRSVELQSKTYGYLVDPDSEGKKNKRRKMYIIKRKLKLEYYINCLQATRLENKMSCLKKN